MNNWLLEERRKTIQDLRDDLSSHQCAALLGEFRMGKTAVLNGLYGNNPQPPRACLSLSQLAAESPHDVDALFYQHVIQQLKARWEGPFSVSGPTEFLSIPDAKARFDHCKTILTQLANRPITLLIDDAHAFVSLPLGEQIFRDLAAYLRQQNNNNFKIVLAATPRLAQWADSLGPTGHPGRPLGAGDYASLLRPDIGAAYPKRILRIGGPFSLCAATA